MEYRRKMKIKLKNGLVAEISPLSKRETAQEMRGFIRGLLNEKPRPFLHYTHVPSLAEEKNWLRQKLATQGKTRIMLVARVAEKIAGTADARLEDYKDSDKVNLGIALAKAYRGIGLGTALLKMLIQKARNLFKPRLIYLRCAAANKPAQGLYRKLGFKEFARFPKWQKHRGKYQDMTFMKLEVKRN